MITVIIAGESKDMSDVSESWINQSISRRRKDGNNVCVQVRISTSGVDVGLSTTACGGGFGGGRLPNAREQEIIALWNKHGLNRDDFTGGNLIAFLRAVSRAAAA